ncbi:MAG: hypothetical protein K1X53_17635 [Candidatus Sumerlaeaceae bacterium]|nr:hypothetical protein [Candidatus Sumerlaeaceae bacterium]
MPRNSKPVARPRPGAAISNTKSTKPETPISVHVFNVVAAVAAGLIIYLIWKQWIIFGSKVGLYLFIYTRKATPQAFQMSLVLAPLVVALAHVSRRFIDSRPWLVLAAWQVAGLAYQLTMRTLQPMTLTDIIVSRPVNSFYEPTTLYSAYHFLHNYYDVAPKLGRHAFTNMPGKILFFYLLAVFTKSPQVMGYIIMVLANLGSLVAYTITRRLFNDRLSALYAMILFLLVPARIYFTPLLNVLAPLEILLLLLLMMMYVERSRAWVSVLMGATLFGVFIMEPLALFSGLVFVAVLGLALYRKSLTWRGVGYLILGNIAGFLACCGLFYATTQFDIFKCFVHIFHIAHQFYDEVKRPYWLWFFHNIKEFFINAGIVQSCVYALMLGLLARATFVRPGRKEAQGGLWERIMTPEFVFVLGYTASGLALNASGIERGEDTRLCLFFTPFLQIIAARCMASRLNPTTFDIALVATVLQTAITINTVRFMDWK